MEERVDAHGKIRHVFVYHGDLYERLVSEQQRTAERYLYILFGILAAVLLMLAMLKDIPANRGGIFSALSLLALIPAFCVLVGAVVSFFKTGMVTKEEYHERIFLLRLMAVLGAGLLLAAAVGYAIGIGATDDPEVQGNTVTALLLCIPAALLYLAIAVREFQVKYQVHKGDKPSEEPDRHFGFKKEN